MQSVLEWSTMYHFQKIMMHSCQVMVHSHSVMMHCTVNVVVSKVINSDYVSFKSCNGTYVEDYDAFCTVMHPLVSDYATFFQNELKKKRIIM